MSMTFDPKRSYSRQKNSCDWFPFLCSVQGNVRILVCSLFFFARYVVDRNEVNEMKIYLHLAYVCVYILALLNCVIKHLNHWDSERNNFNTHHSLIHYCSTFRVYFIHTVGYFVGMLTKG